jgi:hypothetical protein
MFFAVTATVPVGAQLAVRGLCFAAAAVALIDDMPALVVGLAIAEDELPGVPAVDVLAALAIGVVPLPPVRDSVTPAAAPAMTMSAARATSQPRLRPRPRLDRRPPPDRAGGAGRPGGGGGGAALTAGQLAVGAALNALAGSWATSPGA